MASPPFKINERDNDFNRKVVKQLTDLYSKFTRVDRVTDIVVERLQPFTGAGGTSTNILPVHNHTSDTQGGFINIPNIEGGLLFYVKEVTAAYTVRSDDVVISCTGTFTVTLPPILTNLNRALWISNDGTGIITVDGNASETIDDETTQTLYENSTIAIVCKSNQWKII